MRAQNITVSHGEPAGGGRRDGIALIVVLGLLLVLTAMAIGFSVAMRMDGLAARRYADRTRARYFARAGVSLCLGELGGLATNVDSVFPFWVPAPPGAYGHVFASVSTSAFGYATEVVELASNWVPASLWGDLAQVQPKWRYLLGVSESDGTAIVTNGRVAYVAINCSGLMDIHAFHPLVEGGTNRRYRLTALEQDVPTDADAQRVLELLELHREYATLEEMVVLNDGLLVPPHDLFIYSYDPNPHQYVTNVNELGMRWIGVTNRFNVNGLTNFPPSAYGSAAWSNDWFVPYVDLLEGLGVSQAVELAWGTVNLLDADRVPQGMGRTPWLERACSEAVPLINELVVRPAPIAETSNAYEVVVELWYPFVTEAPDELFQLQVGVFRGPVVGVDELGVMAQADPAWSFTVPLEPMHVGGEQEFQVVTTPDEASRIRFPVPMPAPGGGMAISDMPLGPYVDPVSGAVITNEVFLLVRVLDQAGQIVDEAPGYLREGPDPDRAMLHVSRPTAYEVDDPRDNGRMSAWRVVEGEPTPGTTNGAFSATGDWQGLPIVHFDRPLLAAWELGQLYDPGAGAWQNLDLLSGRRRAAGLLDRVGVDNAGSSDEPWSRGRINLNTRSPAVLHALFQGVGLSLTPGFPDSTNRLWTVEPDRIDPFLELLVGSNIYSSAASVFPDSPEGDARGAALRGSLPTNACPRLDYLEEQLWGKALDSVSFRQNLFVVVAVAQSTNPKGNRVQAQVRIMALIYRDAWTGNWFIKDWREF